MKVFLDDLRKTPEGWTHVYWQDEAIVLLKTGKVEEISLDHDLGDDDRGTGYDVILWIEEAVAIEALARQKSASILPTAQQEKKWNPGLPQLSAWQKIVVIKREEQRRSPPRHQGNNYCNMHSASSVSTNNLGKDFRF